MTILIPPGAVAVTRAFFGPGTGPIVLDNIECLGNEESLLSCPYQDSVDINCDHSEDASVICQGKFHF